jgi:hypothetical protein
MKKEQTSVCSLPSSIGLEKTLPLCQHPLFQSYNSNTGDNPLNKADRFSQLFQFSHQQFHRES